MSCRGATWYRVAADDGGRLLAAWSMDPEIHFIAPEQKVHVAFPKPAAPADVRHCEVASFELLPNGQDAVVYMTGQVMVTTGSFRGPSWSMPRTGSRSTGSRTRGRCADCRLARSGGRRSTSCRATTCTA
jgi:hypothetical protein